MKVNIENYAKCKRWTGILFIARNQKIVLREDEKHKSYKFHLNDYLINKGKWKRTNYSAFRKSPIVPYAYHLALEL